MRDTFIGLGLAAIASCCFAAATIIQAIEARGVALRHALRASLLTSLAQRRRWLAGVLLGLCAAGLQLAALSYAPVTVVQPADAAGLLVVLVAGARLLHEPIRAWHVAAAAAIVAGVTAIALADIAHADTHAGLAGLGPALVLTALVGASPFLLRRWTGSPPWLTAVGAGVAFALSSFALRLVADALGAGDVAGVVLFAAVAGGGALLGLGSEMSAVQSRPIASVAPVIFAVELLVPIVLARLVGHEHWPGHAGREALLTAGMLLTLGGATALLRAPVVATVLRAEHAADTGDG